MPSSVPHIVTITIVIATEKPEGFQHQAVELGFYRGKSYVDFIIMLLTEEYDKVPNWHNSLFPPYFCIFVFAAAQQEMHYIERPHCFLIPGTVNQQAGFQLPPRLSSLFSGGDLREAGSSVTLGPLTM